ncbi:MAG: hypothetical protein V4507_08385 [Verrucomicrobiota bacterium]
MATLDFFWIDRYFEIFAFIILAFVAFQKRRPLFFLVVLFLNTLPDLWMISPPERVHWITPLETSISTSTHWIAKLRDNPPQSALTTALHPLIQKAIPSSVSPVENPEPDTFNPTAFYIRISLLIIVLLFFLIDHVHGVAGLGAFLFPTFYFLQRLFQGFDFILPFQFSRQFALFRQNPASYSHSLGVNPSGMWTLVLAISAISIGLLVLYYFTRRQSRTYNIHVPNPENYQVLLQGKPYNYEISRTGVMIETVEFPFAQAFSNQTTPHELHFASGTVLHFVKRTD